MRQLKIQQSVTDRSGPLDRYMREVNSLPMISPEEETDLAYRILSGDDMAFQKLVEANLRFVISVAKQYQGNSMELSDLINEGNIGLMKAVGKYDLTRERVRQVKEKAIRKLSRSEVCSRLIQSR